MIITKLTFHNFGVYAGNNVFEFESSKPVVLIGGMNGRGKTTFLEGVLLCMVQIHLRIVKANIQVTDSILKHLLILLMAAWKHMLS